MGTVRPERPDDVAAIRSVNKLAFGGAVEAEIVDTLRARGKATLSLAVDAHRLVGHILFRPGALGGRGGIVRYQPEFGGA